MGRGPADPADCLSLLKGLVSTVEGSSSSVVAMGACLPGIMGARSFWFRLPLPDEVKVAELSLEERGCEEVKVVVGVGMLEGGLVVSQSSGCSTDLFGMSLMVLLVVSNNLGEAGNKASIS